MMRIQRFFVGVAVALSALAAGTSASATVTITTYKGVVRDSQFDSFGIFGTLGANLSGAAITATFTTNNDPSALIYDDGELRGVIGGADYGTPAFTSAVVSIGSNSYTVDGSLVGLTYRLYSPARPAYGVLNGAGQYTSPGVFLLASALILSPEPFIADRFQDSSVSYVLPNNLTNAEGVGTFSVDVYDSNWNLQGSYAIFADMTSVTSSSDGVAAVPEPATWAMMIGGFGAAGAVVRRRRARVGIQFRY